MCRAVSPFSIAEQQTRHYVLLTEVKSRYMEFYTGLTCTAEGHVATVLHDVFEGMSNGELQLKGTS